MSLVQYSDSNSDSDSDLDSATKPTPPPSKKPRTNGSRPNTNTTTQPVHLPPLPTTFYDLYATSTRVSVQDDPSLHGGRKRAIPHVEGNWPTHLYLEWFPSRPELSILETLIDRAQSEHGDRRNQMTIHSLLRSALGAQLPLHVSLSRPVVLRTEQRHEFIETYQIAIQSSNVEPFDITIGSLGWVSNYERTRWFLVLHAQRPTNDALNRLLKISNRSLAFFDQPPLYQNPSQTGSRSQHSQSQQLKQVNEDYSHCFHISIAWSLTEPSEDDKARVASMILREVEGLRVGFDCVKAKIGNGISSVALPTGVSDQKGIGGL